MAHPHGRTRRDLLRGGIATSWVLAAGTRAALAAPDGEKEEFDVSPAEDLMREHGVLNRLLLVYEESIRRIQDGRDLPPDALANAASIIRSFVEDYHEKLEENHLFPRFEKAGRLVRLVTVLRAQHEAGRKLTDTVQHLTARPSRDADEQKKLTESIRLFIRMYRPHEAREDTVLFPAFRAIVSPNEYDSLGEEFERKEHDLFGRDGFEGIVERVAAIEKRLGIEDLTQFTPKV